MGAANCLIELKEGCRCNLPSLIGFVERCLVLSCQALLYVSSSPILGQVAKCLIQSKKGGSKQVLCFAFKEQKQCHLDGGLSAKSEVANFVRERENNTQTWSMVIPTGSFVACRNELVSSFNLEFQIRKQKKRKQAWSSRPVCCRIGQVESEALHLV